MQHVAEEAHLAPDVILYRPCGEVLNLLAPPHTVHDVEQHGAEESHKDAAAREARFSPSEPESRPQIP